MNVSLKTNDIALKRSILRLQFIDLRNDRVELRLHLSKCSVSINTLYSRNSPAYLIDSTFEIIFLKDQIIDLFLTNAQCTKKSDRTLL